MATPTVESRPSWPDEHAARIRKWVAYAPLAFVIVALLTLAVAPLLGFRSTQAYRLETEALTEPVRRAVTEIHLALAIEADALNDFVRTRDSTDAVRYRRFAARNDHALARLDALAPPLGGQVAARTDTLRSALVRWRSVADSVVRSPTAGVRRRLGREDEHAESHDDALVAAARLDEAISRAAQERQAGVSARERRQAGVTVVLALVALVATLAAGWVGRRLWRTTLETDARRAEVERLMEARARLMRGVTHDLRNPVQVIAGHAGLLHSGVGGSLAPKQVESVDHIRRGARLLVRLIDDLTDLWRLEAGRLVVRREPADAGRLVRAVVDGYRPVLESRGLRLVVDVPRMLPVLLTDHDRVRHILANLLSNAAKYTPADGIVTVSAAVRTATVTSTQGPWLSISVRDTGPGIPRAMHEAIFHEFVRLDQAQQGTGLGLAIGRRVARLLGGEITVASEVGHGSTFTVWLPLDSASDGVAEAETEMRPETTHWWARADVAQQGTSVHSIRRAARTPNAIPERAEGPWTRD